MSIARISLHSQRGPTSACTDPSDRLTGLHTRVGGREANLKLSLRNKSKVSRVPCAPRRRQRLPFLGARDHAFPHRSFSPPSHSRPKPRREEKKKRSKSGRNPRRPPGARQDDPVLATDTAVKRLCGASRAVSRGPSAVMSIARISLHSQRGPTSACTDPNAEHRPEPGREMPEPKKAAGGEIRRS